MKDKNEFYTLLQEVDGREVGEMARLLGDYDFNRFVVKISPVVQDEKETSLPLIVRVTHAVSAFPERLLESPLRRTALEDLLTRKLVIAIRKAAIFDANGIARRLVAPPRVGQKILPRTTVHMADEHTDVRLKVVVPLDRGRIDAGALQDVFFEQLPAMVQEALLYCNMDLGEVDAFVGSMEEADEIRRSLAENGWISFIGAGALVTRRPGTDEPTDEGGVELSVDEKLEQSVATNRSGSLKGAGIAPGITLIIGDAHGGRVELMRAIASGIYNHIAGDGRENIVTMPDAVYISAEAGRTVQRVDIGCFTGHGDYSSASADAAHAQAASFVEALEAGARVMILDEADSAPGFLGGDNRLHALMESSSSMVPLAARARQLAEELGVSTVVAGQYAVGSFIPVADQILLLKDGILSDITGSAKAAWGSADEKDVEPYDFTQLVETARWVIPSSIDASVGRLDGVIDAPNRNTIHFGRFVIDMGATQQVADAQQALTLGLIIEYAQSRYLDQPRPVREVLDLVERDLSTEGMDQISRELRGDLARPRRYEIAAALNRLPSLRVSRATL
ncbi:MAG: P-loop domain-containing protein [Kiritimatiellia bacterium]